MKPKTKHSKVYRNVKVLIQMHIHMDYIVLSALAHTLTQIRQTNTHLFLFILFSLNNIFTFFYCKYFPSSANWFWCLLLFTYITFIFPFFLSHSKCTFSLFKHVLVFGIRFMPVNVYVSWNVFIFSHTHFVVLHAPSCKW